MRKFLSIITALLFAATLQAQNVIDLVISEVMVDNETSVLDDYGEHSAWIEIYNTSQGTVNFGGCYFSDDPSNLTKSPIVKGDNRTKIGPRQVALFYSNQEHTIGTFYINFPLREGMTLYFVSNDGHTIIDSIDIPRGVPAGQSVSKFADDNKELIFDRTETAEPTPLSVNGKHNQKTRAEAIKAMDPHGWILTVVSVAIVFSALMILLLIYTFSGNIFSGKIQFKLPERKKKAPAKDAALTPEVAAAIAMALDAENGGEQEAAIAMALHLYLSEAVHDVEPGIITFAEASPAWKDRTLGFRRRPR